MTADNRNRTDPALADQRGGWIAQAWGAMIRLGLAEAAYRLGTHAGLVVIILMVALGLKQFFTVAGIDPLPGRNPAQAVSLPDSTSLMAEAQLPEYEPGWQPDHGVIRQASLYTDLPSRPRFELMEYTVQPGDTIFSIAGKFGLKPETVLWANQEALGDNPHNLQPGQQLTILPVDGAYHRWSAGDSLVSVAEFFSARPEQVLGFPGNNLKAEEVGDWSNPEIPPGTWLIIPGGRREFVSWRVPEIPRDDPEAAEILGSGACKAVSEGPTGSGVFIWPTDARFLSGYEYAPNANHFGVDVAGAEGDPVYAADSGIVVYAGWNDWGYGYLAVIDHGNGWQTLYAHLGGVSVNCGQIAWQGAVIGAIGGNGSSSEPGGWFVHYEMMFEGNLVDPQGYLP